MAVNACMTVMWTFNFQMCNIEHVTALMCVSAVGKVAPTFLVYLNNYPALSTDIDLPKNWLFSISPNGKITFKLVYYCKSKM